MTDLGGKWKCTRFTMCRWKSAKLSVMIAHGNITKIHHKSRGRVKTVELPLLVAYNTTGFIFHLKKYCFLSTARYVQRDSLLCKMLWFIPPPAPVSLFAVDNVSEKWFSSSWEQQGLIFVTFRVLERSIEELPASGIVCRAAKQYRSGWAPIISEDIIS